MIYGKTTASLPSLFLKEIPDEYINECFDNTIKKATVQIERKVNTFKDNIFNPVKNHEPLPENIRFTPGDRVVHKKFGEGTIISVQQFGKDAKLEINFDNIGRKQLMAVFAKLEKIK